MRDIPERFLASYVKGSSTAGRKPPMFFVDGKRISVKVVELEVTTISFLYNIDGGFLE